LSTSSSTTSRMKSRKGDLTMWLAFSSGRLVRL
jgi:hypothetical protein